MASSTSLRPQNNKNTEFTGILKNQELNKVPESSRSKACTAPSSNGGSENRDPKETSNRTKGGNKSRGVSRLPVLAKSMQTLSTDICQSPSHRRWEGRPLRGKSQKRRTCSKPILFSLSKAWNCNQMSTEGVSVKVSKTPPAAAASLETPKHHQHNAAMKTLPFSLEHHTIAPSKPNKAVPETWLGDDPSSDEMASSIQRDLSAQLARITLAHSELAPGYSVGISGVEDKADCQAKTKSCIQTPLSANCTRKTGGWGFQLQCGLNISQCKFFETVELSVLGAVLSSPDPSHNFLPSEGVGISLGATPRVSVFPTGRGTSVYSAQRVPIKKAQTETTTTLPGRDAISFSPDPGALRSILLNEGIKVGGPVGATPQETTRPSARGASIYSVRQLVGCSHSDFHPVSFGDICCKWLALSNGVCTRLREYQLNAFGFSQIEPGLRRGNGMDAGLGCSEKESEHRAGQPFIQAAHRQSVIVFSSGRKPLVPGLRDAVDRAAAPPTRQHAGQKEPSAAQTSGSQSAPNSDANKQMITSLAVCALRRRLPPLEELFLDEECATYMSDQQSWPTRPRCTNPVASTLLFHDSMCFVPIGVTSPNLSPVAHLSLSLRA
uniref:Uncharacterized protein n=1 Tax=Electrophorus electricus TaxID=8005 RepID=A0A4W4F1U4_ELEEL